MLSGTTMDEREERLYGRYEDSGHEWKVSWNDGCLRDVCALYNGKGGTLVIGRDMDGGIIGVDDPHSVAEKVKDDARRKLSVLLEPHVETVGRKQCVIVDVPKGNGVASCDRGYTMRFFDRSQTCPGNALAELFIEKSHDGWLNQPLETSTHILSEDLVLAYIDMTAGRRNRCPYDPDSDVYTLLKHYHMLINDRPTLTSAILFLEDPCEVDDWAFVRVVGYDVSDSMVLTEDVRASALLMKDAVMTSVSEILESIHGMKLAESYPEKAVCEALVNSIAHKDYSVPKPATVSIHADRLVISNPVPERRPGPDIEIPEGAIPIHLNHCLTDALVDIGLATGFGTGIAKIRRHCDDTGCPEPLIRIRNRSFEVTLFPKKNVRGNRKKCRKTEQFRTDCDTAILDATDSVRYNGGGAEA